MSIDDIPNVELPSSGIYKFIVFEVTDGNKEKKILIGDPACEYHADIFRYYARKLPEGIRAKRPIGGGRIKISNDEIHAYGESSSYGIVPSNIVQELLEEHIKTKGLESKLNVEMGRGY